MPGVKHLATLLLLTSGSALAAPQVFFKQYADGVELFQWNEGAGGQLTGTYQLVYANAAFTQLTTYNEAFTGTRKGGALSLKFTRSFLGISDTTVWTGTLNGATLTLNRPRASGAAGFDSTAFSKSTLTAYNQAVTQLTAQAQAKRLAAQQEAQRQAAQQATIDAQTRAVRDTNREAERALSDTTGLLRELQAVQTELGSAATQFRDDLAAMHKDYQTLLDEAEQARLSRDCFDVRQVQGYDLRQLTGYDLSQLTGYDSTQLQRVTAEANRQLQRVDALLITLSSVAQNASQLQGVTPLSKEPWRVNHAALSDARAKLTAQAAQMRAAVAQAAGVRDDTLAQARTMIGQAQAVADRLTCTL